MTVERPQRPLDTHIGRGMVVVWAPRHLGTRSAWLADQLGIADVRFFAPTAARGLRAAPLKYPRQFLASVIALARRRPRVILVQSPPSMASWTVAAYATFSGAAFVVDAHSDAFERAFWNRPQWLNALVARRAAAVIVTDEHWAARVRRLGGRPLVIPAVPTELAVEPPPPLDRGFNVAVVNTWAPDEPLAAVLDAAELVPSATFQVTGNRAGVAALGRSIPANVRFTGFLPEPTYHGLLAHAQAVICLTTRNHTMQNGAAEALYLGTPIITSDWPILRDYFSRGTEHVDNTARGIAAAVEKIMRDPDGYRAEIRALRDERREQWRRDRDKLLARIEGRLRGASRARIASGGAGGPP
ncbi:MAG TPA: glycosyltransferase [candidate division Zixibacteria bacterium]|nr:glycosyltransferase [candidate division Zixibacteria bacterium]